MVFEQKEERRTVRTRQAQWLDYYDELLRLTERSQGIVIKQDSLSFYDDDSKRAFNQVMNVMMQTLVGEFLTRDDGATTQCIKSYRMVEASLCEKSGIGGIKLPRSLADYLHDATKTAAKILLGPTVRLLQQKMTTKELEQFAQTNIPAYLAHIDRYLYESWIAYGLLEALDPIEFRSIAGTPDNRFTSQKANYLETGYQVPSKDCRLPEALLKTSSNSYYAYKFEHVTEIVSYKTPCRAKDFTSAGNTTGQVCHRVLLLFKIKGFDTVPLVAQRSKKSMMAPDLVVEHLSTPEYASLEKRQEVRSRAEIVNSATPTQVVLSHEQPEVLLEDSEQKGRAFKTHAIGYRKDLLERILQPLLAG